MKSENKTIGNFEDDIFIHDRYVIKPLRLLILLMMYLLDFWYLFLLIIARIKKKKQDKMYYFSICAIFKNEELSLKEWIEHHKIIGVDHIYLYNNFSSDSYLEILEPYVYSNYVTLIDWPVERPAQSKAYNDFCKNYWHETKWVAFIDLDEFFCPKKVEDIKAWFKSYENYPSMVVYWRQFGSSGIVQHDREKLITEQYFLAWEKYYDIGKPIFNTDFALYGITDKYIHMIFAKVGIFNISFKIPPVNEFKIFINYRCNRVGFLNKKSDFTMQINHYVTKSFSEFFENKVKRGTATSVNEAAAHIRSRYAYDFVQSYATVPDYSIYRFLIKLKLAMVKEGKKEKND
ncbi:glycosyltransferase family 92 protein [uncultured Sphingobacterium sp.]|uniref:glycosyltransferase family 92 protein n=1 Tax=uncultured Sphingobacterium sp. TaxID=182688 RepID=UPI0025E7627E|nr:glycosyltransferase family 92 protein [uncultured Sphingobacterium sp.]